MSRSLFVVTTLLLLPAASAVAEPTGKPTPLLEDDLQANKRTKIDSGGDELDAELDSLGGGGFSTKELERIEDRLRAELKRERPRATPRLVVFLYPGRTNPRHLRSLKEVFVDVEVMMDPCERSVCREAIGKHIEMVGRAVGQSVVGTSTYRLVWKTLSLKAAVAFHDDEVQVHQLPIAEAVAAGAKPGGGMAWLEERRRATDQFVPLATRAIAQKAALRRVVLDGAPSVTRSEISLHVRGDRNRFQQQVMDALGAAVAGMRENPPVPSAIEIEVELAVAMHKVETRKFRCPAQPVGLYLDGKLDAGSLWSSYVQEHRKDAQTLSFDDAEATGHGPPPPDDNEAVAVIASHFEALRTCVREEVAKNPAFGGVTLELIWSPMGKAENVVPREAELRGGALAQCLASAMESIPLPRFAGSQRAIEYPIRVH